MNLVINDYIGTNATHPVSKVHTWFTDVVQFDSGIEQRNQVREAPVRLWTLGWSVMTEAQRNSAVEIYNRAKGQYNTFQFRDPQEEDGSSSETAVAYTADAASDTAKTFTVVGDVPEIFLDGVHFEVTGGVNDGDWVCDGDATSDGSNTTVTVTVAPTATAVDATIQIQDYQLNHTYYSGETEEWSEDRNELQHFPIIDVDIVADTLTIAGAHTDQLEAGTLFIVTDSTANDENWVVESVERSGANTIVTVTGDITDATVDGTIVILNVISNAVEMTPGVDYEINEHTGVIQFLNNKSPANAHIVTATYKYNFRVRFNTDEQIISEFAYGKWEFIEVELLEVKS